MILEQLTTENFRGLPNRAFDFSPRITLVLGPNRAGKSTLHQALLTALFGLGKKDNGLLDQWKDALRWVTSGEGKLALQYRTSSGRYRIERALGGGRAGLMKEDDGEWLPLSTSLTEVDRAIMDHIEVASPSIFARTVCIAQGDLARLEDADRQELGRALEEVLVGRTRATFVQALEYLEQQVRKPLRKGGRERILQKLDRYETEAREIGKRVGQVKEDEEQLEDARKKVSRLEDEIPGKKQRLEDLVGDPQKGQQVGLLTKLTLKSKLEADQEALTTDTGNLGRRLRDVKDLQKEIDDLVGRITANQSFRKLDLDTVEQSLRELEGTVNAAEASTSGCAERIAKARDSLGAPERWFQEHPGFRDHPHSVEEAENVLRQRRDLERRLRGAESDLEQFLAGKPRVGLPRWEMIGGGLVVVASLGIAWLTGKWAVTGVSALGLVLLADYLRRASRTGRTIEDFDRQAGVKQEIVRSLEGELQKAGEALGSALVSLGISEDEASALATQYREKKSQSQEMMKRIQEEEDKKTESQAESSVAKEKLVRFCQEFGLKTPQSVRQQIPLVRAVREAETRKAALLGGRTLAQIEAELDKKSVELRRVSKELESPEYLVFRPRTEEVEGWRRQAKQLEEELPRLERNLIEAGRDIANWEAQARDQPSSHELEARLEWLQSEIVRGDRTVQACDEAASLLREVQEQHRTTYLPALEQATSAHFERISGGFYSAVALAKGWPVITVAEPRNPAVPPEQLSGGSRDQLYFAFRLAVADQLSGGEPLPFILDEPFTNLDDHHQERALDILADLGASGRQVIYFTMHPEIAERLEARAAGKFPVAKLLLGAS